MGNRRQFLQASSLAAGAAAFPRVESTPAVGARMVSTWDFGVGANAATWPVLARGGSALDAVEAGARWAEADLCNPTVGRCGNPDRDGVLTLDASIMDGDGRCGAFALHRGFVYAVQGGSPGPHDRLHDAASVYRTGQT